MMNFILRLFKIHRGEGVKVLQFALLGAMLQAGITIGLSSADSLFLIKIGADKLPYIYIITPFIMALYIPLYSYLTSRWGIARVFDFTLGLLTAGSIGLYFALKGQSPLLFYVAKLYSALWFIALYTLFWNFTDSYYDIQDAKRLFAIFSGGSSLGAIIGATTVNYFTRFAPVPYLFLVWSAISALTWPLLLLIRKKWKVIEVSDDETERNFIQEIRETGFFFRHSTFIRLMTGTLFLLVLLSTLNDFQFSQVFSGQATEAKLATLFATLYLISNVFNLIVNFFIFNRMVLAIGVGNVALFAPVLFLFTFIYYLLNNGFSAAVTGFLVFNGFITSIDFNNWNFLYNAVPASARSQVRTFLEGLCEPFATATVGICLLLGETIFSPAQISSAGILLGIVFIALAFFMRIQYLNSMVVNMKKEWLDFSQPEERLLKGLTPDDIDLLAERSRGDDLDLARESIQIMWLNDKERALNCLLNFIPRASESNKRALQTLLETILDENDSEIIRRLMDWLNRQKGELDSDLLEEMANYGLIKLEGIRHLLDSEIPNEKAAAVVALWNSWNIHDRNQAFEIVLNLLQGDPPHQIAGIRALGHSKQERHAHYLEPFLLNGTPEIRREALIAVNHLVNRDSSRLLPSLFAALSVADEEDRLIGMETLKEIGDPECIVPLLELCSEFTPYERRRAESVVLGIGLKSVPFIVSMLRNQKYSYQTLSIAARALSKLAFPQLEALSPNLIRNDLRRAYEALSNYAILEKKTGDSPGMSVLSQFYLDQQTLTVNFVLEILTLGGRLPDFELISAMLRSENRKERADAIETIEQGVSRDVFRMLLPLVDQRTVSERIAFYRQRYPTSDRTPVDIISRAMNSDSPLECAAGAQALWDTDREAARDTLRGRLHDIAFPQYKTVALDLLARQVIETPPTLIEKIRLLSQAPYFQSFITRDLEVIARSMEAIQADAEEILYRQGDPALYFYLPYEGRVRTAENVPLNANEPFGYDAIYGFETYRDDAVAIEAVSLLRISNADLMKAARTYSSIAMELLKQRVQADARSGPASTSHSDGDSKAAPIGS